MGSWRLVTGLRSMGGAWGAVATRIFASKKINPAGADGFIYGHWGPVEVQFLTVIVVVAFNMLLIYGLAKLVNKFWGLKKMIMLVVKDPDSQKVINIICQISQSRLKSGKGREVAT